MKCKICGKKTYKQTPFCLKHLKKEKEAAAEVAAIFDKAGAKNE